MIGSPMTGGMSTISRAEAIADITLNATNTVYTLPTQGGQLPNDRFMYGVFLKVSCRTTNPATNAPTGVQADAPFSLIERVRVGGYHRVRAQREDFIDLRGRELYELAKIYSACAPMYTPTTALVTTANSTNDIAFMLFIPFVPLGIPLAEQEKFLLDCPNYDNLQLTIQWADDKSVFTGQTNAVTFSAFGSATGSPKVSVVGLFCLGGQNKFRGFVPARVWRYAQEVTSGDVVSGANNSRLYAPPRGFRLRSLLMKLGVKSGAVTAGNNVYNSYTLANNLKNIKVFRGINRMIRSYPDPDFIQAETSHNYGILPSAGYALIDFAQKGSVKEALDTTGMIAGPTGDTDLFVQGDITAAASQAALFVVEEVRHAPYNLYAAAAQAQAAARRS